MKYNIIVIILLIAIVSDSCKKDAQLVPKQYPYVITKDVSDISSSGATFEAEILDYGHDEITDFGFIYSDTKFKYQCSLIKSGIKDKFSTRISSDLQKGTKYTCQAYIKTTENLVLGNTVTFEGLGSEAPVIYDFIPKAGFDGTLVKLEGKYFSQVSANNKVYINNIQAQIVSSSSDLIEFRTPRMSFFGDASVMLKVGSQTVTSNTKFSIPGPKILSISSTSGHPGDYITIEGENFIQNGDNTEVYFDYHKAKILSYSENKVNIIVPSVSSELLSDLYVEVRLVNGLKSTCLSSQFLLKKYWENKQATPFDWSWAYQAFTLNEKGYILELNSKKLYEYNPAINRWDTVTSSLFPGERNEGSLYITAEQKLYKVGGYDYNLEQSLTELWTFDFNNKIWAKKSDLPFGFLNAVYYNLNNQIYVVTDDGQAWKCDFINEQYTRLNNCPFNFEYTFASSFVGNGKAFIVTSGHTWLYDEQNDSWIEKSTNPFSSDPQQTIGFALNNTGYVLDYGEELYKYDIIKDKWIPASTYPGPRGYNTYKLTFIIGNTAYVAATSSNYVGCAPLMYSYQE